MRLIGMLLLIAAGSGTGWYFARRLSLRVDWLEQMERLMEALGQRLRYEGKPQRELWEDMKRRFPGFEPIRLVAEHMGDHSFRESWEFVIEKAEQCGFLQAEELEFLREFGETFGRSDAIGELNYLEGCRKRLEELRRSAEQKAQSKGAVYRMAGFSGGTALALLML